MLDRNCSVAFGVGCQAESTCWRPKLAKVSGNPRKTSIRMKMAVLQLLNRLWIQLLSMFVEASNAHWQRTVGCYRIPAYNKSSTGSILCPFDLLPMSTSRILVALATYNEIENVSGLVEAILKILPSADVLVIDDNSPDGTGQWCDKRAANDSHVACVHRPGKQGLGSATIAGMRWAMERNYDAVITMDADWSHDPVHLPELVSALETADVAIGSRYCAGGQIIGWPIHRRLMSRTINRLSRLLLHLPISDTSGAFRAYRISALRKIDLANIRAAGYSYLEEILWHLHRSGANFREVPITFRERRAGESKVSVQEAIAKISTLMRLARAKKS